MASSSLIHQGTPPAGALTTILTLPCGSTIVYDGGFLPSTCLPPDWDKYWSTTPGTLTVGYYSPAICPSGWTVCASRYKNIQGPSVEPTETDVQCAPMY